MIDAHDDNRMIQLYNRKKKVCGHIKSPEN